MTKYTIKIYEDDVYEYGKSYIDNEYVSDYMRLKSPLWVSETPKNYLEKFGIFVDSATALMIEQLIDGDSNILYWMSSITDGDKSLSDIFVKLLLGPIARESKNKKLPLNRIVLHYDLYYYVRKLSDGTISQSSGKALFEALLVEGNIDSLIEDGRFKSLDVNFVDEIINEVFAENVSQVENAKTDDRIINWLIGQVMKKSKGKAPANVVKTNIQLKLISKET